MQNWINQQESNVEQNLQDHHQRMMAASMEAEEQRLVLSNLIVKKRRVAVEKEKENLEGNTLQKDLQNIRVKCDELGTEVELLQTAQRKEAVILGAKEEEIARLTARNTSVLAELQKSLSFYRKFGLNFEKVGNQKLRLTFTLIDPRDHAREFWFYLHVNGHDQYRVDECSPPVEELPSLLATLNSTNDFATFVISMRKAFKQMV